MAWGRFPRGARGENHRVKALGVGSEQVSREIGFFPITRRASGRAETYFLIAPPNHVTAQCGRHREILEST